MKNLVKVLMLVAVMAISASSFAQVKFGVQAGLNLANFTGDVTDSKMRIAYNFGGVLEYALSENLAIQSGLLLSSKGAKGTEDHDGVSADVAVKPLYIEVPISVAYKINSNFNLFAGPYLGYGIGGKISADVAGVSADTDITYGSDGMFKALDYGLNVGVGVEFGSILLKAQYGLGLANIANGDGKVKNAVIGVSVGYMFGGK